MRDGANLEEQLRRIDGRGYRAYRDIEGAWDYSDFALRIDHAQGDPFAAPSRVRASLSATQSRLPEDLCRTSSRAMGIAALLARTFADLAFQSTPPTERKARRSGSRSGRSSSKSRSGRSGEIRMEHPGQIVTLQTAVAVAPDGGLEARFTVGLPGRGRTVEGRQALELFFETLPALVADSLTASAYPPEVLETAAHTNEDAEALRAALRQRGLVAFVADGAHLARSSGDDDRPLGTESVSFGSPASLRVVLDTPNAGSVPGMAVREGVTLITGGGFHGKSTLLRAIQDGVWNHAPGDGREQVVTISKCAKIRAEDGRPVTGVDISTFIAALPNRSDTRHFTTANASGSTSQAAAIMESIEAGATALLIDEDTSATNFMIRDRRMQALVPPEAEPITPFVDRVRALYDDAGVSTILVIGGSGDYLDPADRVIRMTGYLPSDVTTDAARIAEDFPTGRASEAALPLEVDFARSFRTGSLDASRGKRTIHVRAPDQRTLQYGTRTIDLVAVEQLSRRSQIRTVGLALAWFWSHHGHDSFTPEVIMERVTEVLETHGLDAFADRVVGDLTAFRPLDLMTVLNRLREVRVD